MWNLTWFLGMIWALTLLYGEWFTYLVPSMWTCSWPHLLRQSSSSSNVVDPSNMYLKIAVVADPQLMDRTSLPLAPKSVALETAQFYADLYIRRAFLSSVLPFRPDAVVFMGDYFDGGYVLSDDEWQESLSRLRHIFSLNMLRKTPVVKTYFLSGNHDVGYSAFLSHNPEIVRRYEREFGLRNFIVTLGNVEFVAVDAQSLDGDLQKEHTSETWSFVRSASNCTNPKPRVVLTHIPLHRPDSTPCGPHRSSPVINQRIRRAPNQEIVYQNYVTENSSQALLELIKPLVILSGHDHDQCTASHKSKHGVATEHTIGTVSWQQGNLYPSFVLLSVRNSTRGEEIAPEEAILTHLCFLPQQTHIYLWYLALFAMTVVIVLVWPSNEVKISRTCGAAMSFISNIFKSFNGAVKLKNEEDEDDCELEEIWDAEGSMHLIKKTRKKVSTPPRTVNNYSLD
ncbi:hypothetical protein M569_04089, partial [Genlisea aurea]